MTLPTPAPDRTCLVTGASSGIGADIARELAARGHGLVLVARGAERLRGLTDELNGAGVRVEAIAADLASAADRARLLAQLEAGDRTVDVLVNNAGVGTSGAAHRGDPDRELALVRLNIEAVVDLCSRLLPGMVGRGRGAILNVASTAAFQPLPGQASYAASKAFVLSYTEALRAELRATGVTVTALCPGPVETGFGEAAGISDEEAHVLPSFMWVSSAQVAKAGVTGLDRDRAVVIPGAFNRAGALSARYTPHPLLMPVLGRHPSLRR
ncbi:MAG TPA: SDR family oxidoreductase [Mycobacteriales bacterium]|nr:SDR family oxidoreductase [Mycobacteriales bacterium]